MEYCNEFDSDEFIVKFEKGDPRAPLNWSTKKKVIHTAFYGLTTFSAQFNSSCMAPTAPHLTRTFNINLEVATLATSLYVLGIAFGPMVFAPFSEVKGRKIGILLPFAISIIFTMGTASSDNVASILCTRFFAGLFAGAPVVSSGGIMADMWHPAQRGTALVFYALFVVLGPTLGPIISSLLTQHSDTAWRWPLWFSVIVESAILILDTILLEETYVPVLLTQKAQRLRLETRNWALHAPHEDNALDMKDFVNRQLVRPIAMLATPILFFIALFASYVYGLLYILVTTIPYTFEVSRGWSGTVTTLPMIALFIGVLFGSVFNIMSSRRYARILTAAKGKAIPEERLYVMMLCAWLMPAGIFVFAWTSRPSVHWIAPCIGISMIGAGFFVIFQGCLNYLVDTFTKYAASAIASNTLTRSIFGAVFPLFSHIMFQRLGVDWGGSLVGFVALGMIPIPYVFYAFGPRIRSRNPYAKLIN